MELKQEQVVLLKQAIESQAGMWNSLQAIIGNNEIISKSQNELSKLGHVLQAKDVSLGEGGNTTKNTDCFETYIEYVNPAPVLNSKSEHTNFENEKDFSYYIENPELSKEVLRFALVYKYFKNLLSENFELEQFSDIERKIVVNFYAVLKILHSFESIFDMQRATFLNEASRYKIRLKYIFPENKELTESLLAIAADDQKLSEMQRDLLAEYGWASRSSSHLYFAFFMSTSSMDSDSNIGDLILDYKERHPNFYSHKSNYKELLEENHQLLLEYIESLKFLKKRKDLYEELKKIDEIKDIKDMCEEKYGDYEIDEKKHKLLRDALIHSIHKKSVLVETYSENYKECMFKEKLNELIEGLEEIKREYGAKNQSRESSEISSQSHVKSLSATRQSSQLEGSGRD